MGIERKRVALHLLLTADAVKIYFEGLLYLLCVTWFRSLVRVLSTPLITLYRDHFRHSQDRKNFTRYLPFHLKFGMITLNMGGNNERK